MPTWLGQLRIAGRFEAAEDFEEQIDDTADLYRGETFVVLAPADHLSRALRERGLPGVVPSIIEIDSGGWRTVALPEAGSA